MLLIIDSEIKSDIKIQNYFNELGLDSIEFLDSAEQARVFIKSYEQKNTRNEITLIIIDSQLDDGDGFELCREIKKTAIGEHAYIILLISSAENKTAIENARHSGASGFAIKPYHSSKFKNHLAEFSKLKIVLLVDDDPLIRKTVRAILADFHIELIEVEDGISASNLLNTLLPCHLILMDIGLPDINGIQLVEKIRSKSQWKKIPIVMLTASTDISDVKKSLAAGANQYIAKPFNIDDFKKRLSGYFSDAD